jgi:hypothetical protein
LAGSGCGQEGKPASPSTGPTGNTPIGQTQVHSNRDGLVRLAKDYDVWLDRKTKTVIVAGKVCLREGPLEMFACPAGTKEHESIVAVDSKAFILHAALLAAGAQPGQPAQFEPSYSPARGDEIEVQVTWTDQDGHQRAAGAGDWVRNVATAKPLEHPWVFVGSGFWTDPETGKRYYQAEAGELICVSNFSTAMMDLPIPSSQANDQLLYEAFTERIPPLGTKVQLRLRVKRKGGK